MRSTSGSGLLLAKFFWWVRLPMELILSTAELICLKKFIFDIRIIKG